MLRASRLLLIALLASCAKPSAPVAVAALAVVQGDFQSGQAARELAAPVVLRVTDADGNGIANRTISLVVFTGGGSVDSVTIKSDARGEARIRWTLGTTGPVQELRASLPGTTLEATKITATALFPSTIVIAQGMGQTAKVNASLTSSVVVRVIGPGNVPMVGINVAFQVLVGGGSLSPQSIITGANGEATTKWTLGPSPGVQSASILAGTLAPVLLTATATP
ncbi:MAG: hypothetical protein K2X99_10070 [Gemmatimonadaceae bacterium]|nr:hypothetical protein [Gemmatimonadaceae bacterium]